MRPYVTLRVSFVFVFVFCSSVFFKFSLLINAEIHGGTLLAFKGKESVLLASDSRFSSHKHSGFLIGTFPRPVFRVGSKVLVGCVGLDSDARLLMEEVRKRVAGGSHSYEEHFEEDLEPEHIARLVSNTLYNHPSFRLYCAPVVCGIDSRDGPFICSMDGLGAQTVCQEGFAVTGTANAGLYAICEAMYKPNLSDEDLVAMAKKCLTLALQRDVLSGCKVRVMLLKPNGLVDETLFDTSDT